MTKTLKVADLKTVAFSIDSVGKLFFYEDRILRGINKSFEKDVQEMFDSGLMQELILNQTFVDSWISDVRIEGYDLIIEHQRIENWNYSYEWSPSMLKAAARTVLKINTIANEYNFELYDVHTFNMVFDNSVPKYVDLGSIFKQDPNNGKCWSGYLNFYNSFYMPLFLYSKGFYDLPQSVLLFHGIFSPKDLFKLKYKYTNLLGLRISDLIYKLYHNVRSLSVARDHRVVDKFSSHKHFKHILRFQKAFQGFFTTEKSKKMLDHLGNFTLDSYWKNYHDSTNPSLNKRFLRLTEIVNTDLTDAESLIELAANQGKFSNYLLDNTQLDKIIATDYDKNAVDAIYTNNAEKTNILPLLFDFVRPNGRAFDTKIQDRIRADIVMALAVTHHLILTQDISLVRIFNVLESLTNKYIIVEFMPMGLYSSQSSNIPSLPQYYTLEWFKNSFSEKFDYILDEEIDTNRHVFVGKLKPPL